jgi:hypothetical protein
LTNVRNCFGSKNNSRRLNIFVHNGSASYTKCINNSSTYSLTGSAISWTNDTTNNCTYNTAYNIYIYPVTNVQELYKENELLLARYTVVNNSSEAPVIQVKQTPDSEYETVKISNKAIYTYADGTRDISIYAETEVAPSKISFEGMTDLVSVDHIRTQGIINADRMFANCINLTSVYNEFELPNVQTAKDIYYNCNKLQK